MTRKEFHNNFENLDKCIGKGGNVKTCYKQKLLTKITNGGTTT